MFFKTCFEHYEKQKEKGFEHYEPDEWHFISAPKLYSTLL